ncbi:DUF554 domain-containing protein [candidate division KSB1 bacterium]
MIGTIINAGAVITGGIIGIFINYRLPERFTKIVFQGIGLFTIFLGISLAIKTNNFLLMIFSIVIGAIVGELIDIEKYIDRFANYLKRKVKAKNSKFTEGFITAFLLYCVGSMTILGSIEEGLGNPPRLLLSKSILDGFSSIALAAALGFGVILSAIPLLLYQGFLTLFASYLNSYLNQVYIDELSAVGGILLIGLGITILEIKKIKIINMLPALIIVIILTYFFLKINWY